MDGINMNEIVGTHHILFITLDSLRFDVANQLFQQGLTPVLQKVMPGGWEKCHTPGTFTYAAHHAFFAGFLPTPAKPGKHSRLLASRFTGSETTTSHTCVFEEPTIIAGLANRGYRTICIGGVGFFNKQTPLGNVLPGLFNESYWQQEFSVTDPESTQNQFRFAATLLKSIEANEKTFLFINVSAIHQPNCFYVSGAKEDSLETHAAALQYVDSQLPILFTTLQQKGDTFCLIGSDHGTAYGEEGYTGHRLAHPSVWEIPFSTFLLPKQNR
jgi:hypothetical protein